MRAALLLAVLAAAETTEIDLTNFDSTVVEDSTVWMVRFMSASCKEAKCKEFDKLWIDFSGSLSKLKTGTVDVDNDVGKDIAEKMGVVDIPSFQLFKGGAKPEAFLSGEAKTVKVLRKMLKKALKGHGKTESGQFKTNQSCDVDEPKTAKYLLYDVGVGERFNMRRNILNGRVVDLMENLLKIDPSWTLVIPPFRQFGTSVWERWDTIFDTSKFGELLPGLNIMEAEDYLSWRKRLDHVSLLGDCKPEQIDSMSNFDHNQFGKFVVVGKIKCNAGIRPQAEEEKFAKSVDKYVKGASVNNPKAILIDGFEQVSPKFSDQKTKLARRGLIRFHRKLKDEAMRYLDQEMGNVKYVSMHFRQGDFLRKEGTVPSPDEVVAKVREVCKERGLENFVLLTNGDNETVEGMKKKLASGESPITLWRYAKEAFENREAQDMNYLGQGDFTSLQVAAIEQIIASQAEVFFGTSTSTFSKEIHLERYLNGFDWKEDVSLTLLPGGITAKMCNYDGPGGGEKCEAW